MTDNKLTLRLRTNDNLLELLAAGKSGEWKVGKNKENEISKVQIFNWDRTLMLEASLDISNTSRRTEDNRLIVGLGADAKISKCHPPLEWKGQNSVKYFNEHDQQESEETESDLASESIIVECYKKGSQLKIRVVSSGYNPELNVRFPKDLREEGARYSVESLEEVQGKYYTAKGKIEKLELEQELEETIENPEVTTADFDNGLKKNLNQICKICEQVLKTPIKLIDWELEENKFNLFLRDLAGNRYFEMLLIGNNQGQWSTEYQIHPIFQTLLDTEGTWMKLTEKATEADWTALDGFFSVMRYIPESTVMLAGENVIGETAIDEALERFNFYIPDEDLLPVFLYENKLLNMIFVSYFKHPDNFAGENMVQDNNAHRSEIFNTLPEAIYQLMQKLDYYAEQKSVGKKESVSSITVLERLLQAAAEDIELWNEWRKNNFYREIDLSGADLTNADLTNADLEDVNLSGADLSGANLTGVNLIDADLSNADLTGANLSGADLSDTNLTGADLTGANLTDANLTNANLSNANLTNANLSNADLTNANLSDADLTGANLTDADLTDADLTDANLTNTDLGSDYYMITHLDSDVYDQWKEQNNNRYTLIFRNADLSYASLSGLNLSHSDFGEANLRGANLSGADLRDACFVDADLSDADLSGADLSGADLSGADLSGADLDGADLRGADLSCIPDGWSYFELIKEGANVSEVSLSGADLSGADLSGSDLSDKDLSDANLSGANLSRADLSDADLSGANLSRANLSRANLSRADLSDADLSGADLSDAHLSDADLSDADLTNAVLTNANLMNAVLTNANLTGTILEKASLIEKDGEYYFSLIIILEHLLKAVAEDIELWNEWRRNNRYITIDLSRADLSGANLSGANLSRANLTDANLSDADLSDADLTGANLYYANLRDSDLSGANLSHVNLYGANLTNANLTGANLSGAYLGSANLTNANLTGTFLEKASLIEKDGKYYLA
jgi:uncharacterized protein YjbI with pentapeptide repeats